jgi:hypothetical protein
VLVMHFIHADRVIARPLAVIKALAERKCSFVKCSSDWQGVSPFVKLFKRQRYNA